MFAARSRPKYAAATGITVIALVRARSTCPDGRGSEWRSGSRAAQGSIARRGPRARPHRGGFCARHDRRARRSTNDAALRSRRREELVTGIPVGESFGGQSQAAAVIAAARESPRLFAARPRDRPRARRARRIGVRALGVDRRGRSAARREARRRARRRRDRRARRPGDHVGAGEGVATGGATALVERGPRSSSRRGSRSTRRR